MLIIDDTIEEKPYTDERELICWHYDHSQGRSAKGINLLSTLYQVGQLSIPVSFELVKKEQWTIDGKTKRKRRKSRVTKNEQFRQMLSICQRNQIQFKYVLNNVWYASSENMSYINNKLGKHFVMLVKSNRKVALSKEDKALGRYQQVATLELEPDTVREVYVEQVEFPLLLCKQVFKNGIGSEGVLYLVSDDVTLDDDRITTIYKRRWNVEIYHKSLKCNTAWAKSPTKTVRTQSNHCFTSIYAFVKLERMKQVTKLNHFALRSKIYLKALQAAFQEMQRLRSLQLSLRKVSDLDTA